MNRLLFRSSLRYLTGKPLQLILSLAGISLGVAVVVAIDLTNHSSEIAFQRSTEALIGRATHTLTAGPAGVREDLYRELRVEGGQTRVAPVIEGLAQIHEPVRILGVDVFAEALFRPHLTQEGGALSLELLRNPNALMLSTRMAERLGLAPGASLELNAQGQKSRWRLSAVLEPADPVQQSAFDHLIVMDIASAQRLLQKEGFLSRIDVILNQSNEAYFQDWLKRHPEIHLNEASQNAATARAMTEAFRLNLSALSLLALLVGTFLVFNTVSFSVVRRRRLWGLLRALGTSRTQVFTLILSEALVLGLLGSGLGLLFGFTLAGTLLGLVTQTINDLYYTTGLAQVELSPVIVVKTIALGGFATTLAATAPAWEASRDQLRATFSRAELERETQKWVRFAFGMGVLLAGLGVATFWIPTRSLIVSFFGLFIVLASSASLAPYLLVQALKVLRPLLSYCLGLLGLLASRGLERSISRTAVAISALMLALSVIVGVGTMVSNFRSTVVHWLEISLKADVYVSTARRDMRLSPHSIRAIEAMPEVREISTYRRLETPFRNTKISLAAAQFANLEGFLFVEALANAAQLMDDNQAVMISESFAFHHGLKAGDTLTLTTDQGLQAFPIAGVYYDYGSDRGLVMLPTGLFLKYWRDPGVTSLGLMLHRPEQLSSVVSRIERMIATGEAFHVRSNRDLKTASIAVFDRTFAVTEVLRWLALIVAFVGILSSLLAVQLENAFEMAVLRAQGLTPWQSFWITSLQSALIGTLAGLFSLPVGSWLAWILIHVVNRRSFGWTLPFSFDFHAFLQAVSLGFVAATLAGLYPAWRLSQRPPAEALREPT